jgi:hypothetical protein
MAAALSIAIDDVLPSSAIIPTAFHDFTLTLPTQRTEALFPGGCSAHSPQAVARLGGRAVRAEAEVAELGPAEPSLASAGLEPLDRANGLRSDVVRSPKREERLAQKQPLLQVPSTHDASAKQPVSSTVQPPVGPHSRHVRAA